MTRRRPIEITRIQQLRPLCGVVCSAVLAVLATTSLGCGRSDEPSAAKALGKELPSDVSLVSLIAVPERYNKKKIRVTGFAVYEFEHTALYLTKEHWDYGSGQNAVWFVSGSEEISKRAGALNRSWVLLEGVFNSEHHGHLSGFSAAIVDVSRFEKVADHRAVEKDLEEYRKSEEEMEKAPEGDSQP